MMTNRWTSGAAALAVALGAMVAAATNSAHAQAQDFPAKPIRWLIPFPPGGGTDFVSRLVAGRIADTTKWPIVLENRPGAGGNIAIEAAAKSPPDGYTVVMGQTDNVMLGPWLYPNIGYDTVKSLTPIVQVSSTPLAIVSASQSKIVTPADLIAKGKTPSGVLWGTAGNGTVGHLFGEQLARAAGVGLTQIHYRGATPALTDVMGGQIDVAILSVASVTPLVRSGKLNGVAVTSAKRSPALPNAPALAEAGLRDVDVIIWLGLFAPAGTPAPIVARINAEVNKALENAEVREKIAGQGVSVAGGTSEAFAAFVRADYARWGKLVRESGVKVE
jgi:tripartite-type tricarboxylate transporter receptor subunit TctC